MLRHYLFPSLNGQSSSRPGACRCITSVPSSHPIDGPSCAPAPQRSAEPVAQPADEFLALPSRNSRPFGEQVTSCNTYDIYQEMMFHQHMIEPSINYSCYSLCTEFIGLFSFEDFCSFNSSSFSNRIAFCPLERIIGEPTHIFDCYRTTVEMRNSESQVIHSQAALRIS